MKKTFEYNYEIKSANTLDIDDIGNVCIKVLNIFNNYWYLIISTSLGETNIKTFGPINIENKLTKIKEFGLNFAPLSIKVGHDGEFIVLYDGVNIASLDMEAMDIREWKIDGESFGWVDKNMIYSVADGKLIVYDFDGLNRRELAGNVSSHFPAFITNDKWLYYFSDNILIREWLIET